MSEAKEEVSEVTGQLTEALAAEGDGSDSNAKSLGKLPKKILTLEERLALKEESKDDDDFSVLTMGDVMSVDFDASWKKLSKTKTLSGQMDYNIKKIGAQIKRAVKLYDETRTDYVIEYSKKDENGEPAVVYIGENTNYTLDPKTRPLFNTKIKELNSVEIKIKKFKYAELGTAHNITGDDLLQLTFISET